MAGPTKHELATVFADTFGIDRDGWYRMARNETKAWLVAAVTGRSRMIETEPWRYPYVTDETRKALRDMASIVVGS